MRVVFLILTLIALSLNSSMLSAQDMDNKHLYGVLEDKVEKLEGDNGAWSFTYNDHMMLLLTDERSNRMRIITPIDEVANLSQTQLLDAMTANFHTALDVKYAISDDLIWSVFIHPLKELSESQVKDALNQVALAADTFGSSYTSSELMFPGGDSRQEKPKGGTIGKKKM